MRWTSAAALVGVCLGVSPTPFDASAAELRRVEAAQGAVAQAFEPVGEGDRISLDLTLDLKAVPEGVFEAFSLALGECPFGPLDSPVDPVDLPTGDTHLLVSLWLGDPERHAANLASCEYRLGADGPEAALRLRGCFLALEIAVPTARQLALRPLAAARCEATP